jgi:ribonuclease HI
LPVKSFTSLTEAEAFMRADDSSPSLNGNPSKFYAVQNGRVPGVYTDWPTAQKQITGWTKPKHKSFSTRAEAEAFVREGASDGHSAANVHIDPDAASSRTTPSTNTDAAPPSKKAKVTNSKSKDKKGTPAPTAEETKASMTGEPLYAPLPSDAEDGFDRRVIMDLDNGKMRWKTNEELNATKMMFKPDNYADSLHIYTDGACRGNGQKGAIAGVGVYFGPGDERYSTYIPHTVT